MKKGRAFLVNVSIQDLPFPIKVASSKNGQSTVANISIKARIMKEFEAEWIDKFIQVTHSHRDNIGIETMRANIKDYIDALSANSVRIEMSFPYFVEKRTPRSNEPCLVKYDCTYASQYPSLDGT
jgi:GTP cyclohydrolase I